MKNELTIKQRLRRIWQKSSSLNDSFSDQATQIKLAQNLYAKNGFDLQLTCSACPEQYDVFCDSRKVGYLRLRYGSFTVDYPDCLGELLLHEYPDGDGMFENYERLPFLVKALRKIQERIKENNV